MVHYVQLPEYNDLVARDGGLLITLTGRPAIHFIVVGVTNN